MTIRLREGPEQTVPPRPVRRSTACLEVFGCLGQLQFRTNRGTANPGKAWAPCGRPDAPLRSWQLLYRLRMPIEVHDVVAALVTRGRSEGFDRRAGTAFKVVRFKVQDHSFLMRDFSSVRAGDLGVKGVAVSVTENSSAHGWTAIDGLVLYVGRISSIHVAGGGNLSFESPAYMIVARPVCFKFERQTALSDA